MTKETFNVELTYEEARAIYASVHHALKCRHRWIDIVYELMDEEDRRICAEIYDKNYKILSLAENKMRATLRMGEENLDGFGDV